MTAEQVEPYIGRFVDVLVGPQSMPHYRGVLAWAPGGKIAVEVGSEAERSQTTLPHTPIPIANVWKIVALDPSGPAESTT